MKVLYLGATWRGSNAQSWRRAFEALGHDVTAVDIERAVEAPRTIATRVLRRLRGGPGRGRIERLARTILDVAERSKPDLVFAAKAIWLEARTLDSMKRGGALLVHWHPDDYKNPANTSPGFQAAIPVFDVIVTPKSFNVSEYRADGARRVEYVPYAYDPEVHRPVDPRDGPPTDAAFVGGWERERATFLEHLAASGVRLEVWGAYWHRLPRRSPLRPLCTFREALGDDMGRVFASTRVSLGFLRKVNRDLHTARTFEIPASGGVMLTERTDEQREFFEEDLEALYFDTKEELLEKTRFYAARPAECGRIREAALRRCARSRYSYRERLEDLLSRLELGSGRSRAI